MAASPSGEHLAEEGHGRVTSVARSLWPYLADGKGQEFGQGGLLVLWLFGELEPLSYEGFKFVSKVRATPVTHPDVGSHEGQLRVSSAGAILGSYPASFCVKGVLAVVPRTPSFFMP